jgi:hypothetical protein
LSQNTSGSSKSALNFEYSEQAIPSRIKAAIKARCQSGEWSLTEDHDKWHLGAKQLCQLIDPVRGQVDSHLREPDKSGLTAGKRRSSGTMTMV